MPFSGDTFTKLYNWLTDPQRNEKIFNSRLDDEFGGVATGLTTVKTGLTTVTTAAAIPGYGYFVVNRNGADQTSMTGNADNKIQFTTELVDSQGFFDNATNYRFLPTQAGWYLITVHVATATGATNSQAEAAIYKNGSAYAYGTYTTATSASSSYSTVSALIQLNGSTDYVEGYVYLPAGVTEILGDTTATYMHGFRVG